MIHLSKAALFGAGALALLAYEVGATTIKFGTIAQEGPSPEHMGAVAFKDYVEQRSSGRINVRIFPGGQLGSAAQLTEGVRDGTLEMAQVDDGSLSTFVSATQVFTLPYVINSEPEAWEIFRGEFRDRLAKEIHDEIGAHLLSMAVNGLRSFTNSRRPIRVVEDVAGLKLRVIPSQSYVRFVEALGAAATPVPAPELILALQQGVADGQENHPTVILNFGIADVQSYLTLSEHIMGVHSTIINGDFYDGLPEEDQMIISEGAAIQAAVQNVQKTLQHATALERIAEKGIQIEFLSVEEKHRFRDIAQPSVREHLIAEIGEDWVAAYEEAAEAARLRLRPNAW